MPFFASALGALACTKPSTPKSIGPDSHNTTLVKLHRRGVFLGWGESLRDCKARGTCRVLQLDPRFASFEHGDRDPQVDLDVSGVTQFLRGEYFMASTDIGPWDYYPLNSGAPALEDDETLFLHSTNPAGLNVVRGAGGVSLFWNTDQRTSFVLKGYELWRRVEGYEWAKLGRLSSNENQYWDSSAPPNGVGYKVKTVDAADRVHDYSGETWAAEPSDTYFRRLNFKKTSSVRADPTNDVFDANGYAVFNNSYTIEVQLTSPGPPEEALIVQYGHCQSEGDLGMRCKPGFSDLNARVPMQVTGSGTSYKLGARLTLPMVFINHLRNKFSPDTPLPYDAMRIPATEDLIFRVYIKKGARGHVYPIDGGYFTSRVNNRIWDRGFGGYHVDVASAPWIAAMASALKESQSKGNTAVFFDEWRPQKTVGPGARETFGGNMEAPAIEYRYRTGPDVRPEDDPWIAALDRYALELKARVPGMKLVGNSIWPVGPVELDPTAPTSQELMFRAAENLDGVYFENCLTYPGSNNVALEPCCGQTCPVAVTTGGEWIRDIAYLERAAKTKDPVICFVGGSQQRRQEPQFRLYNLVSILLLHDAARQRVYLGYSPLDPTWKTCVPDYPYPDINHFPEFDLDLGVSTGPRQQESADRALWFKTFEKGLVLLNSHPTATYAYQLPRTMRRVAIVGNRIVCDSDPTPPAQCQSGALNPGRVELSPVSGEIVVPPMTGVLLLN